MSLTIEQKKALSTLSEGNPAVLGTMMQVVARQRRSLALHARSLESVSAGRSSIPYFSPVLPVCVEEASGARIRDVDGNEYVDCHMGYTSNILGHNPAPVVEGVRAVLGKRPGAGYFVEEQVQLGEVVKALLPHAERAAFLHSGADAVAAAIRLARASRRKSLIAKFEGSYHGWHEPGMFNTAMTWAGRPGAGPLDQIPPVSATGGVSSAAGTELLILPFGDPTALELIRRHASELAGVVAEPVPRYMMHRVDDAAAFMRDLRATTKEAGVPLIFDEVVTGFRLAPGGAAQAFGVVPDLACYAKITCGLGLPLSIVAGSASLLDAARTDGVIGDYVVNKVWISTTNAANTLTVTAALHQLRHLQANHAALFGALDAHHARLRAEVARIAGELGVTLSLDGHARLYSMLTFRPKPPAPTGNPAREYFHSFTPHSIRYARLLTLYLRLQGVFMEGLPSTDLSVAHGEDDIHRIASGLSAALYQMKSQGVFAA